MKIRWLPPNFQGPPIRAQARLARPQVPPHRTGNRGDLQLVHRALEIGHGVARRDPAEVYRTSSTVLVAFESDLRHDAVPVAAATDVLSRCLRGKCRGLDLNMACYSMGFEHHVMSGSIDRGPGAAHRRGISAFPDIAGELSRARQVPRANGSTTLTASTKSTSHKTVSSRHRR